MQVRFETFLLDSETRELLRDGHSVPLSPKAFELLSILVADRPKAISKSNLQERLWPTTFVVEKNLANLVSEIRDALGDDPSKPRFIRTVQRFGYAFRETLPRPAVEAPASRGSEVSFLVKWVGGRLTLDEGAHVLGRDPDAEIFLSSPGVSRRHARITISAGPGDDRRPRKQERDVCRRSASGRLQIAPRWGHHRGGLREADAPDASGAEFDRDRAAWKVSRVTDRTAA